MNLLLKEFLDLYHEKCKEIERLKHQNELLIEQNELLADQYINQREIRPACTPGFGIRYDDYNHG